MKRLAFALALLAAPAMAEDTPVETVTVNAATLDGLWQITGPPPEHPGDAQVKLHCRIEHATTDPAIHCFERPVSSALTLRGNRVRIAFYPTLLQTDIFEAELTSPDSFAGSGHLLLSGISMLHHEGLEGRRQTVSRDGADVAGKAPLLRTILSELAGGHLSRPYDNSESGKVTLPRDLKALGTVTAITYMGMADTYRGRVNLPDFFAVYLVDFQNGQRFCGLHISESGILDGFRCV